jgi:hypothetical protein
MRSTAISIAGLLLLLVSEAVPAVSIQRATARLPDVPPPPQTRMEWIARSMRMNGLPMALRSFDSSLSVSEVLAHYARWWTSAVADPQRETQQLQIGSWQVLALTSPQVHITVRAQSAGSGATGTIAVSSNPALVQPSLVTSFPYPREARVVSLQQYEDPGSSAESIAFSSGRAVEIAARDFTRALARQGWNVYRDRPATSTPVGRVLEAQKGAELAQLTFAPGDHSSSRIVVVWRKE